MQTVYTSKTSNNFLQAYPVSHSKRTRVFSFYTASLFLRKDRHVTSSCQQTCLCDCLEVCPSSVLEMEQCESERNKCSTYLTISQCCHFYLWHGILSKMHVWRVHCVPKGRQFLRIFSPLAVAILLDKPKYLKTALHVVTFIALPKRTFVVINHTNARSKSWRLLKFRCVILCLQSAWRGTVGAWEWKQIKEN